MPKNPTSWSNNDIKPTSSWANNDVKPVATWANNDVKNATTFTAVTKNSDTWQRNTPTPQSYFYNDPTITYDSPLFQYDYMVNNNTDNARQSTKWAQVV